MTGQIEGNTEDQRSNKDRARTIFLWKHRVIIILKIMFVQSYKKPTFDTN